MSMSASSSGNSCCTACCKSAGYAAKAVTSPMFTETAKDILPNTLNTVAAAAASDGFTLNNIGWKVLSGIGGSFIGETLVRGAGLLTREFFGHWKQTRSPESGRPDSDEQRRLLTQQSHDSRQQLVESCADDRRQDLTSTVQIIRQESEASENNKRGYVCKQLARVTVVTTTGAVAGIGGAVLLNGLTGGAITVTSVGYGAASIAGGYITGRAGKHALFECPNFQYSGEERLSKLNTVIAAAQNLTKVAVSAGISYCTSELIYQFIDFVTGSAVNGGENCNNGTNSTTDGNCTLDASGSGGYSVGSAYLPDLNYA